MRIEVLYFAAARERAGSDSETIELAPASTLQTLSDELGRRHPALAPLLAQLRFALNQEFAGAETRLKEGDEVALIPPVAGGSGSFVITGDPLELGAVIAAVGGPSVGGIATFSGTVRDHSRGRGVRRLEYEAFGPMAVAKLQQIGAEVVEKWPGTRLAIHHRVGVLQVGEAAVVIAAAAAHRKEALHACEYAIDRLKEDVPIWKKEFYEDGEAWIGLGP